MTQNKKCRQCGGQIEGQRFEIMKAIDPDGIFCDMRCAAKFGVRAARILDALERVKEAERKHEPK